MKPTLMDMSTWHSPQDLWVFVIAVVGLIALSIWAYYDE